MKTKFLFFAFALFSYTLVIGQNTYQEINERASSITEQMVSALDLNAEQQELVFRQNYVWLDDRAKFDKLTTVTDRQRQNLQESKENYIKNLNDLLTDKQRVVFKNWLKESKFLDK